jgi:hypothetical protein
MIAQGVKVGKLLGVKIKKFLSPNVPDSCSGGVKANEKPKPQMEEEKKAPFL